ncbi:MAG: hypothetical protein KKF58_01765 [Gammaproteobacteria bacterium]|nr:hypothetical protein [Gammaproteobacteria bacterium]
MKIKWSDRLTEETRAALSDLSVSPQGILHMKNINGGYGKILFEELSSNKFIIWDKRSDASFQFASSEDLISSGWAID